MDSKQLSESVDKKIGKMTEADLIFSIEQLPDHEMESVALLYAIHNRDFSEIGKALMFYLYKHTQEDVLLHEVKE